MNLAKLIKPWVVLLLAMTQIIASFLPPVLGWQSSIAERSAQLQTPSVPITFAFSIWGLIFAGSLVFAIFGLLPQNRDNKLWHRVAWLAAAVFALNTVWEIYVPLQNLDIFSWFILALAAATAIFMVLRIAEWPDKLSKPEKLCIAVPMQIFAGWLSAATFVGIGSTLLQMQVNWVDPRADLTAILAVGAATVLAGAVIIRTRALPYAATIIWALSGVAIANVIREDRPAIVITAGLAVVLIIGVALYARSTRNAQAPA